MRDWILFRDSDIDVTEGIVTLVDETNVKLNEQRVFAYYYEFIVNGVPYRNKTRGFANRHQTGDSATVEFRIVDPRYSRITNLNTGTEGLWFTIPFVSIGLVIVGFGLKNRLKGIHLLKNGLLENAILLKKEKTNSSVNDHPVYKFTFGYTVENDDYKVVAKTHDLTRFSGEPKYEREEGNNNPSEIREPILYLPNSPKTSVLLDSLPGGPRIDENGQIVCSTGRLALVLLAPLLVTLGHIYWITRILAP